MEQGWGELAAFYIDRALRWFKKPPATGRYITNKELYANDKRLWSTLKRWLPTYRIPVCLISWYEGIRVKPPLEDLRLMMTHHQKIDHKRIEELSQISDVMIFDFLVGDPDRIEPHNWIKDKSGSFIFWDSGLSFRRGPHGVIDRDLDILCGRREWVESSKGGNSSAPCERSCVFRNSTIEMLKSLGHHGFHRLGTYTRSLIQTDPLSPIFNFGLFIPGRTAFPKVRYRPEDFYDGLNIRVRHILNHVSNCVSQYGISSVLLPDTVSRHHQFFLNRS